MSDIFAEHPTEEALSRCVLNECDEATTLHLEQCVECREFVESLRTISHEISSITEATVPEELDDAVLAITSRSPKNGHQAALPFWALNPLSLGLLAALVLIALGVALVMLM